MSNKTNYTEAAKAFTPEPVAIEIHHGERTPEPGEHVNGGVVVLVNPVFPHTGHIGTKAVVYVEAEPV